MKPKYPTTKESAQREVSDFLQYVRDYGMVSKRSALSLIRELRLAYRMSMCGAGPDRDGPDYSTVVEEAGMILSVLNYVEKSHAIEPSTHSSLSSVGWETIV